MLQLVNGEHLPDLGVGTWTLRGDTAAAFLSTRTGDPAKVTILRISPGGQPYVR